MAGENQAGVRQRQCDKCGTLDDHDRACDEHGTRSFVILGHHGGTISHGSARSRFGGAFVGYSSLVRGLLIVNPKATATTTRKREVLVRALGSDLKLDVA